MKKIELAVLSLIFFSVVIASVYAAKQYVVMPKGSASSVSAEQKTCHTNRDCCTCNKPGDEPCDADPNCLNPLCNKDDKDDKDNKGYCIDKQTRCCYDPDTAKMRAVEGNACTAVDDDGDMPANSVERPLSDCFCNGELTDKTYSFHKENECSAGWL